MKYRRYDRRKGWRNNKQKKDWEIAHEKIVKSIWSKGEVIRTGEIVERTGLSRKTVRKHLRELIAEGNLENIGIKGHYKPTGSFYISFDPRKTIPQIISKMESWRMTGHPDISAIVNVHMPRQIISSKEELQIHRIIFNSIKNSMKKRKIKLKDLPDKFLIIHVLNKDALYKQIRKKK